MAKCDEGYRCEVCGQDVEGISDSDLYLRYVLGRVDPETLHTTRERHLRCNPVLAQFIVDPQFEAVAVEGDFDKQLLDSEFVQREEQFVTRGWLRLRELSKLRDLSLLDYPLPEAKAALEKQAAAASKGR